MSDFLSECISINFDREMKVLDVKIIIVRISSDCVYTCLILGYFQPWKANAEGVVC
jgi:hypothetical protein